MNTRLKSLYKEAYGVRLSVDDFVLDDNEEKFAQLIVKECMRISNESGSSTIIADRIAEHFGVE